MKTYKKLIILIATIFLTNSCKKFVEGVNKNPNSFTDAPGTLIIGHAQLAAAYNAESSTARLAGIMTDQFTGSDRQFLSYENYNFTASNFDDIWSNLYVDGLAQAKVAKEKAIEEQIPQLEGVSDIFIGYFLAESALLFGDVPASEAIQAPEIKYPKYDPQQDVLNTAINYIDQGLQKVQANKAFNFAFVDNQFNWVKVGNSLKARYYLAMKDYNNALQAAQLGISSPNEDLLIEHEDIAGKKNMFYQFVVEQRQGYMTVNGSGSFAGQGSTWKRWLMNGRPSGLSSPGDVDRANQLFISGAELNTNSGALFAVDSPFPVVNWIETKLIEAEAAERLNAGDGLSAFNEVRDYLNSQFGGYPHSSSTGNQLIKEILEEKYLALPGSTVVFQDLRRTNNLIGVTIKANAAPNIPQRFLYPQEEINSNINFPGLKDLYEPTPINQ